MMISNFIRRILGTASFPRKQSQAIPTVGPAHKIPIPLGPGKKSKP
jgi:hypothetical protein